MLEIELCRICLTDSIRMYRIEHTRYHEIFEWYTEDTMDMNDELPYSVCYLCNAVLNRLYDFLKNMIDTEIYLKEIIRNSSKLTYESVEKLKSEMISKPHNLSKIWLRNSNFIALDAFKGHAPPRELQRYFNHPPIMIEYHKPYEHMKLEDIPEEQEPEAENEEEPGEKKEVEIEENMEVESEKIREAGSENINEPVTGELNKAGTEKLNEVELQTDVINEAESKKTTAESATIIAAETKEFKKAGSEELEQAETKEKKEANATETMEVETNQIKQAKIGEIKDKEISEPKSTLPAHESKSSEHSEEQSQENQDQPNLYQQFKNQPEHNIEETTADQDKFASDNDENISIGNDIRLVWSSESENEEPNISTMEIDNEIVIDPIDSFLQCAKKYIPPKDTAKPINKNVTKEYHNPYLKFIEERIAVEEKPQEKKVVTPEPVKYHDPCLQDERIPTQESPPIKKLRTSDNLQNLQLIDHIPVKPVKEPEQKSNQMEIEKNIYTNSQPVQQNISTELTAIQLEESYYNLYLEPVKDPFKIPNEPIVIEKFTPISREPVPVPVSKTIKPTKANEPAKIIVTSEPKKYIHSYVDFVKDIEHVEKFERESNQGIVAKPKCTRKRNLKKKRSLKIVAKTPVLQQKPFDIDGKISGFCYFDHQKRYRRASILRKSFHPNRNSREIEELANKIKNRAAELRKEPLKFQKTDLTVENVSEKNAVIKHTDDEDQLTGISKLQENKSPKHLPLISKEHSDKLVTEIPIKLLQDRKNTKVWHVVEYPVKSKQSDGTPPVCDEHKDHNQSDQYDDQEKNSVTKPATDDEDQPPGRSKLLEKNTPKHLPLKSKEHSDKLVTKIPPKLLQDSKNTKVWHVVEYPVKSKHTDDGTPSVCDEHKYHNQSDQYDDQVKVKDLPNQKLKDQNDGIILEQQDDTNDRMWSDQDDSTMDSQVDRALKVLDESLNDDIDLILHNEDDQELNMPNDHNMLTEKNYTLQFKDDCIIIDDDLEDNNKPEDQDAPSFVVQDVFTLKDQCLDDEHLIGIPKEQYDQIIMMANQDDQVIEDGNVAVKIESVDEDFQGAFEENHEKENVISDTETFNNEDMDFNNDSDDMTQDGDIKTELERNMQIDEEVSEYEPYLQENVTVDENTTQTDLDGPSDIENPDFESNANEIQGINEQEHYEIRNISQISLMPTVQLERLPIALIKKTKDDEDKYNCSHCDFKTTVRLLMFRHQNVHDMNKRFVCNVCQHRFLSHYHLSRHKVIHDRTKYYCSYCDFKTEVKLTMDRHEYKHNKLNRFPCQWCQRRFRSASHRSRHSCTKKKYSRNCEQCLKEFKNAASYWRHVDTHTGAGPKRFKCSICNKSFESKKKYLNHYVQHRRDGSEKKKYTCKWCNKTFRQSGNCNKHMMLHEVYGEKISSETEDKQEMNETDNEMELNENEIVNEGEKFICGLCPQSFDTEIDLGRHAIDHIL